MITDDEIRDALEYLAQHAPDPDRVRHQLAARDRARRQRRALTLVGGAMAAGVAVGAPLVVLRNRHSATPGSPFGPAAYPSSARSMINGGFPLRYRPTWLPDGVVETGRSGGFVGPTKTPHFTRQWHSDTHQTMVSLSLGPPDSVLRTGLTPTTVRGVPAGIWTSGGAGPAAPQPAGASGATVPSSTVVWQAEPGLFLQVEVNDPDSTTLALKVANSVTTDQTAVLEMPIALGWLPKGIDQVAAPSIGGDKTEWEAMVSAQHPQPSQQWVEVLIGTANEILHGGSGGTKPVNVIARGLTGTYVTYDHTGVLRVSLPSGLGLRVRVQGTPNQADLIHVADTLSIGPTPDLSWLGTR